MIAAPYLSSIQEIFRDYATGNQGLSRDELAKRRNEFGENRLTAKKKTSALSIFLSQWNNTLILILVITNVITLGIYFFYSHEQSDLIESLLIFSIVLMMVTLGFIQEYKAEKSIEALKKMLAYKATVIREAKQITVPVEDLVPGDLVILEEGMKVPADMRLIDVTSLRINEASLTGESVPVTKQILALKKTSVLADQNNMVFSGTSVTSGRGQGIVIHTGDRTEIGKIAYAVSQIQDEKTPIQQYLDSVGKQIGMIIIAVCCCIFLFTLFIAQDYSYVNGLEKVIHAFIASVALAVAAIPEGLPAVVIITLAIGTQRMLKKNVLVRKLNSIETLGSTDVICTDKTGTLTKGEMTVREIYCNDQVYSVSGTGYEVEGQILHQNKIIQHDTLSLLLRSGLENNNASLASEQVVLGDPTEIALLVSAHKGGIKHKSLRHKEIPFSSERKKMTVVIKENGEYLIFVKGAPEIIVNTCTSIVAKGEIAPMTINKQDEILQVNRSMAQKALRTLAFGYKRISEKEYELIRDNDENVESNLVFLGIQGMQDAPRTDVKPLIQQCQQSGIKIMMMTGDHVDTAKAVADEIGIEGQAISGAELEHLSENEFSDKVDSIRIYARVNPQTKLRVVDCLKKKGHIVAMTGDGVNDAPAIRRANIGIAMGITGTDVTKESADMILLDDKFETIIHAIQEGRGVYQNIQKFVQYLLACNISEVVIVFFSLVFFREIPLTATMLLWINVITDGLPAVALAFDPIERNILDHKPATFQKSILSPEVWIKMIKYATLMGIGVLILFYLNLSWGVDAARGVAFMSIVIFELLYVLLLRRHYAVGLLSNHWLLIAIIVSFFLQIGLLYIPLTATLFKMENFHPVNWFYMSSAAGVLVAMAVWMEKKKQLFLPKE